MKEVIIYDDFYGDPSSVRSLALDADYESSGERNHPGNNSYLRFLPNDHREFFSYIAGEPIKPIEDSHSGGFRIQKLGDHGKQYIHVDLPNFNCKWAGVCYLSLPEHYTRCDGTVFDSGTKFWKHRRTGMEKMPFDTDYLAKIDICSPDDLRRFMETEGADESLWINTFSVPIKFNRLVMFRSNLWHSQGELFGDSKMDCRLIQTFFFEPDHQVNM